ncbi:MAG: PEP-CTERM sorting domain-containing protein [Phycisphaerae bacterium]|nr:PEP-CTERM sorting domain-containing protein [Phycisphaerae bacterium]
MPISCFASPELALNSVRIRVVLATLTIALIAPGVVSASPWATSWQSYDPGSTPVFGYTNPDTALGMPERFTGENEFGGAFASAVTMFNSAFGTDEVVSIGEGGHLTLELGTPATNNPSNPYGVDLIIFGNAGFTDSDYPNGTIGSPASLYGFGFGRIELSADGVNFFELPGLRADTLFPTQGYQDVDPLSSNPGSIETDFFKPVNPALTLSDFDGLSYAQALALYDGSGGGTPIDIGLVGLSMVTHVRILVDDDFNPGTFRSAEIDAITVVPEPASAACLLAAAGCVLLRRGQRRGAAIKPFVKRVAIGEPISGGIFSANVARAAGRLHHSGITPR